VRQSSRAPGSLSHSTRGCRAKRQNRPARGAVGGIKANRGSGRSAVPLIRRFAGSIYGGVPRVIDGRHFGVTRATALRPARACAARERSRSRSRAASRPGEADRHSSARLKATRYGGPSEHLLSSDPYASGAWPTCADPDRVLRGARPPHDRIDQRLETSSRVQNEVAHLALLNGLLDPAHDVLPLRAAAHRSIVPPPHRRFAPTQGASRDRRAPRIDHRFSR
jgi:hypothetical protein